MEIDIDEMAQSQAAADMKGMVEDRVHRHMKGMFEESATKVYRAEFPDEFSQIVVLFADALILVTIPLHIKFLHVLLSQKNEKEKSLPELEKPYRSMLIHFMIHSILFCTSNTLILEPALLGIASYFYKENAFWLARIELTKSTVLPIVGTVAHLFIALNRLSAIAAPVRHSMIWTSRRVHCAFIIVWAVVFLLALPIIIDNEHIVSRLHRSIFNTTAVEYHFVGKYNNYYQLGGAFFGLIVYGCTLIVYVVMMYSFRKVKKNAPDRSASSSFAQSMKLSMTSFIMTIGGWLIHVLIIVMLTHIWVFNTSMLPVRDFSVLIRFFNALHNVLMPWIMAYSFKTVRSKVGLSRVFQFISPVLSSK